MFACRPNFLHVGPPLHAVFLHVEPPPILIFHPLQPGVYGLAGRSGGVGSDGSKWSKFQNPSKKMRLDESFRMVPVSCHLEVVVKSYGQITVWENVMGKWGRNVMDYIFGGIHWTPSKAVVIHQHQPGARMTVVSISSLKLEPAHSTCQ